MGSDYDQVAGGGGLKLKGADKKKKKKSSTSKKTKTGGSASATQDLGEGGSSSNTTTEAAPAPSRLAKTPAEERFEAVQKQRLADKVKKQAVKTHKDRVADFNDRLESLSEHYDIPKVGPG